MNSNTNLYIVIFTFILIIAFTALQQHHLNETQIDVTGTQGITPLRSISENRSPASPPLNILFIGNSYTFFYDVPGMILKIAKHDKNNATPLHVRSVTYGGATLRQHWKNPKTKQIMQSQHWDILVLQEQSLQYMYAKNIAQSHDAIHRFYKHTRPEKTDIVLFKTWPRQPNSAWYSDPQYAKNLRNAEAMFTEIHIRVTQIAKRLNIRVAPIADYWYFTSLYYPDINLYSADATHASVKGSYLTALIFYQTLTGNSPLGTTFVPLGMTQKEAATLRKIAAKTL
ncbi:MAG: DUF4886 domain-containing protein [Alcanivorax sp.]